MFTIDLLKRQGVPIRTQPQGIALGVITLAVPLLLIVMALSSYLSSKISISLLSREIAACQASITKFGDVVQSQKQVNSEKQSLNRSLNDVGMALTRYTQWTPIIISIVENMPDSIIMTNLEVKRNSARISVPLKDDPTKKTTVTVPRRSLHMTVCSGTQANCAKAVREFSDRLRLSDELSSKLEDIKVSRSIKRLDHNTLGGFPVQIFKRPSSELLGGKIFPFLRIRMFRHGFLLF